MRARPWIVTASAGLVLADASIVTLALPELLGALDTTVEGVAAVIAVYTLALALALLPAERLLRRAGAARTGAGGFVLFALASAVCAGADSLAVLLAARAVQAIGGAAGLIAAFELIAGGTPAGRRHWLGAAVLASAAGPALGGALTQAFDWRAIFIAQVPLALAGALAARAAPPQTPAALDERHSDPPYGDEVVAHWSAGARVGDFVALALVSAALTAVLFGLVLLLVAGWAVQPLVAAATVTVLPLAALAGARLRGAPRARATAGALLVGGGVLALAWLPGTSVAWTLVPQALAGVGMGLALPAFAGELLPERQPHDAARLLTIRHAGIALVLVALAPLIAARLEVVTERAQQQGVALVLDARLPPQDKLALAPALLAGIEATRPRDGLERALDVRRADYEGDERIAYETLGARADETLVSAVGDAFRPAFLLAGVLALLGAVALAIRAAVPRRGPLLLAAALALAAPAAYAALHAARAPEPVAIADPCEPRDLPDAGGISGFLQDRALEALDAAACRLGSSREELVLAFASSEAAERFERRHGVDPRSVESLLRGLIAP
jgi:MFS family permease